MKIVKEQKTEVEIEILFPAFFKVKDHNVYYALLSEEMALSVYSSSISTTSPYALIDSCDIEITAEEFTRVFDERIEQLQQFKSQFFTK